MQVTYHITAFKSQSFSIKIDKRIKFLKIKNTVVLHVNWRYQYGLWVILSYFKIYIISSLSIKNSRISDNPLAVSHQAPRTPWRNS